jgi:hypothetical protein
MLLSVRWIEDRPFVGMITENVGMSARFYPAASEARRVAAGVHS